MGWSFLQTFAPEQTVTMKRIFLGTALFLSTFYLQAQNLTMPQPSPTQTIKQNFGVGNVELSYSRPGLKGRKIGTDLAPFGQVWRTGANNATVITFSDDVTIGGTKLTAGKYGILSIPQEKEWTIIITKDLNVSSPAQYKQENDVVRVKAPVKKLNDAVETFTMDFYNFTNESCELNLAWGNTSVSLPITTVTDEKVMKQINDVLVKDNRPYFGAAQYYFENGKDLAKAKEWIDIATKDPRNEKAPWVWLLKARIYQKSNDKAGAKAAAEKSLAAAKEIKNEEYVKNATELLKQL